MKKKERRIQGSSLDLWYPNLSLLQLHNHTGPPKFQNNHYFKIRFSKVLERKTLKPKLNFCSKIRKGLGSPVTDKTVKKDSLLVYVLTSKLSFLTVSSVTGDPSPFRIFEQKSTWASTSFFQALLRNVF